MSAVSDARRSAGACAARRSIRALRGALASVCLLGVLLALGSASVGASTSAVEIACHDSNINTDATFVLSPLFAPTSMAYTTSVPYPYVYCLLTALYTTGDAVAVSYNGGGSSSFSSSASLSPTYNIATGAANVFKVTAVEGTFTITLTRAASTLSAVGFATASGPAFAGLVPAFTPGGFAGFRAMLPYASASVTATSTASSGALYYSTSATSMPRGAGALTAATVTGGAAYGAQTTLDTTSSGCVIQLGATLSNSWIVGYDYIASAASTICAGSFRPQTAAGSYLIVSSSPLINIVASASSVYQAIPYANQWQNLAGDLAGFW
jgi:hypothetical protein